MTQASLISSSLLTQGFGRGPDFSIYTGAMRPMLQNELPPGDADKPIVSMRGSSVIEDLQGDTMRISALQDMAAIPESLTFWLNHRYDLPDDAYGKLYGRPKIELQDKIADIWLATEAFLSNPPAEKTYRLVKREGARLGCSVGCQVLEMSLADPKDPYSPIFIDHVYVVEFSIVGIPANQRCWVENAIKGVFTRSLAEGDGDKTLSLAPAFKGLFSKDFDSILRGVTSDGLRKDLENAPSRGTTPHRILYDFTGIEGEFILRDNRGFTKPLSRDEVSTLLQKSVDRPVEPASNQDDKVNETMDITQKSVTGKTSWPLMDIGTEWTGSKAEKQIFDWARDDNGDIQASKASQCFLYTDPDNNDKQSGFKMPFTYIVDGSPKIVPLGVRACGNVLAGGMGGVQAGGDEGGMKAKVKTLYGRINSEFKPDPEWTVPWEKGEKAAEVEITKADEVLDTDNGKDLIRQDLEENMKDDIKKGEMPQASDVEVDSDGSHVACTGSHTHAHKAFDSQGDDKQHEHQHAHDGDANHDHEHADDGKEKSGEPAETAAVESVEVEKALDVAEQVITPDPQQVALLTAYNTIGKQLGLEPIDLTQKCAIGDANMQEAIGLISQADACIDGLAYRLAQADMCIDQLMAIYNIPDVDKMPETDEAPVSMPMASYSAEVSFLKSFDMFLQKEGKELNEKNRGIIAMMHDHTKSVHDMCKAMHPDACKCDGMGDGTSQQDNGTDLETARQDAKYQMGQEMTASLTEGMNSLAKALSDLNIPHIKDEVETAQKSLATVNKQLSASRQELTALNSQVAVLKNVPLGRPTQLNRSVAGEASYADMRQAIGQPLNTQEVLSQTNVVTLGFTKYRHWPAGIGNGQRPALSLDQKSLMRGDDILAYQDGEESYVPLIEE